MQELSVIVKKLWGQETWLVNEPEYCCKILDINKGASGSLHYHPIKKETFIVIKGEIQLEHNGREQILFADSEAITIQPGTPHRFRALQSSSILEISTHHDDNDIIRLEESKGDKLCKNFP